jgi:hypothetical protein
MRVSRGCFFTLSLQRLLVDVEAGDPFFRAFRIGSVLGS